MHPSLCALEQSYGSSTDKEHNCNAWQRTLPNLLTYLSRKQSVCIDSWPVGKISVQACRQPFARKSHP